MKALKNRNITMVKTNVSTSLLRENSLKGLNVSVVVMNTICLITVKIYYM